jgi:metal-responsive CopG/Arc/MetJ family transcriptional regulator
MALKNVKRVTFSLPKATVIKLEMRVPKNKRSKFIAKIIDSGLDEKKPMTFKEYCHFWDEIAGSALVKTRKTAVDLIREDRASH